MSTLTGLVSGGGKPNRVTVLTSGSGSFTPLSSNSFLRVTLVGAGGSGSRGGGGPASPSGAGGEAGSMTVVHFKASAPSYSYAVGAGGTGPPGTTVTGFNPPPGTPGGWLAGASGGNTIFGAFEAGGGVGAGISVPFPSVLYNNVNRHPASLAFHKGGGGGGSTAPYQPSPTVPSYSVPGVAGHEVDSQFPAPSPVNYAVRRISPSNGGTATSSYPSLPARAGGGGGGSSVFGPGGAGGSAQSPHTVAVYTGASGPSWGTGGGGGAVSDDGFTEDPLYGNIYYGVYGGGGNGNSGAIFIEEFVY